MRRAFLLLLAVLASNCGDDDHMRADSGADGGPDSGDPSADAGPDASVDGGSDAGEPAADSGPDASVDAGVAVPLGAQLATGIQHSCARRPSGAVACWGRNQYGQLGNGT